MRFFPILTAALVTAVLYLLIFERDRVIEFAMRAGPTPPAEGRQAAPDAPDAADAAPAAGSSEAEDLISVVVLRSAAREIPGAVLVRGRTEAARQVVVRAETSGQVISEPLRKGARVDAGEVLCRLDPGTREAMLTEALARLAEAEARVPEAQARLPEARARLSEAQARLAEAEINLNAARALAEDGFASESRVAAAEAAYESATAAVETARAGLAAATSGVKAARSGVEAAQAGVAAARKEIERLTITAPFEGLLESDAAELGSLLQPGAPCATVIQLDPIKLVGFVPETEVSRVRTGMPAAARLATGEELTGTVTFLAHSADPLTRTFRVEVMVPNPDLAIRDGQTVEIVIASDATRAHLLPQSSLTLDDDGRLGVRTVDETGTVRFAPVTVVRDSVQGVWVAGLPPRADVIVVGQEYVAEGVKVAVAYREPGQ